MRHGYWLILLMVTASGCGNADRPVQGDLVVDPAATGAREIVLSLDSPRRWSFGGAKENIDDELLRASGVMGLAPLSRGGYLLSEGERVRVFDRDGRETWRHGREGEGPQEYRALGWPCTVGGDTVVVTDQRSRRFPFIAAGDSIASMVPGGGRWINGGYCSGMGWVLVGESFRDSLAPEGVTQFRRMRSDGSTSEIVVTGPASDYSTVGVGQVSAGVVSGSIYLADPNTSVITIYDSAGTELRKLTLQFDRVPVTDENIPERYGMYPAGASPEQLEAWWTRVRTRSRTEFWPAFGSVQSDGARLWISTGRGREGSTWLVISPEGRIEAKVRAIPYNPDSGSFMVIDFVPDGPVALYSDDDDMLHIAVLDVWR